MSLHCIFDFNFDFHPQHSSHKLSSPQIHNKFTCSCVSKLNKVVISGMYIQCTSHSIFCLLVVVCSYASISIYLSIPVCVCAQFFLPSTSSSKLLFVVLFHATVVVVIVIVFVVVAVVELMSIPIVSQSYCSWQN